jgi:calcineurin-like phosphoesterase family protein
MSEPAQRPPHRHWTVHPGRLAARLVVAAAGALLTAAVAVSIWPYRTTVAGIDVVVSASVTPEHRGISVDSSLGTVQFPEVTALPLGLHVAPRIDLGAVRAATGSGQINDQVRSDLKARRPALTAHFGGAALAGLLAGGLLGGLVVDGALLLASVTPAEQLPPRRRRLGGWVAEAAGVTAVVSVVVTATGFLSYRSDWATRYEVTGILADVAATPQQLAALDARDAAAAGKIRAVLRLQSALTRPAPDLDAPPTAYSIMFISDVHRRDIYPYLQQYIDANNVQLIVNTGDETLAGRSVELTPGYRASIAKVTADTPMIWVKGNHDSSAVAAVMDDIPGVVVLDGQMLTALGLQIYGIADPRTYGAAGAAGSDDPQVVTGIETRAAVGALTGVNRSTYIDLLLAHEPVMADTLAGTLGAAVRAEAAGHVHRQNPDGDLQSPGREAIRLVEGTTGLGGLLAEAAAPMSFSVLSVGTDCQFTRIVRYQLADPALPATSRLSAFGNDSSFDVRYFRPQPITTTRRCSTADGIGTPVVASSGALATVEQWHAGELPDEERGLVTPGPVGSADEQGDQSVPTVTATRSATPR